MKFQWRKWFRVVHRDFGYLFFGLTLVYSISGIALNHLDDWNSNYIIVRKEISLSDPGRIYPGITKAEALNSAQLMFSRGEIMAGNTRDATRGMRVSSPEAEGEAAPSPADATAAYKHPFYWAPFILMGNWL